MESAFCKHHQWLTQPGNWSLKINHFSQQLTQNNQNVCWEEMRDSCVHYHVPPGYICSKTAFRSQRKGLLLRLWARPLVSKCVIIFAFGTARLTEWPFICSSSPGDRGDTECLTAAESSSNSHPCGQLCWHDIDDTFKQNGSPHVSWEAPKTGDSLWQEGTSGCVYMRTIIRELEVIRSWQ